MQVERTDAEGEGAKPSGGECYREGGPRISEWSETPRAYLAIALSVHIDANKNIVVRPECSGDGDALLCLGVQVSLGDIKRNTAGFARLWLACWGEIGNVDL